MRVVERLVGGGERWRRSLNESDDCGGGGGGGR